ncbi:TniQ family protein [Catenulispora subtropica]
MSVVEIGAVHVPRRLVLVEPLESREAFGSWVDRMARRNRCPPGLMVELLGLPVRAAAFRNRVGYGVVVDDGTCRAVKAATGVTASSIRLAHLSAYDGTALDLAGLAFGDVKAFLAAARAQWADFYGSRACPRCLAASGGVWQMWWKLSWAAVCPLHGCLLIEACPDCGGRLRRGRLGRPAELSLVHERDPVRCAIAQDRRRACQARLDQAPTIDAGPEFGQAQSLAVAAAEGAVPAGADGPAVASASWFASLKALTVVIRLAAATWVPPLPGWAAEALLAEALEARHGTKWVAVDAPPSRPAAAAGLLLTAVRLLKEAEHVGFAEVLGPLVDAASIWRTTVLRNPLMIAGLPASLADVLAAESRRLFMISR